MPTVNEKYLKTRNTRFDDIVYKTYKHLPEKEYKEIINQYLRCREIFFDKFFNSSTLTTYKYQFEICTILISIINDSVNDKLNELNKSENSEEEFEYSIYKISQITKNINKQIK